MKLAVLIGVAVAVSVAAWFIYQRAFGIDEVEYRGETFKLRKRYLSYEGYRNDSPNLATGEPERIETRITEAKIGTHFQNWARFASTAFELKFPGYGAGGWALPNTSSGPGVVGGFVEIPQTGRWRYFVLAKSRDESLQLIDDFVEKENLLVSIITFSDGTLSYTDRAGVVFRKKHL
jgi:hypothetical protein